MRLVSRIGVKQSVGAEIYLGTRTVMQYLLSPVSQTLHQAGRAL